MFSSGGFAGGGTATVGPAIANRRESEYRSRQRGVREHGRSRDLIQQFAASRDQPPTRSLLLHARLARRRRSPVDHPTFERDARVRAIVEPAKPQKGGDMTTPGKAGRRSRDRAWVAAAGAALATILAVAAATLLASDVEADVQGAVLAAAVTGIISVTIATLGFLNGRDERDDRERVRTEDYNERREIRREEVVLRALEYFTGKTQRRNVGISIVEFHWDATPRLRGVFVPLLVNQAVYLLEQSDQTSERHEADNLRRIMVLLLAARTTAEQPAAADYRALRRSVARRLKREDPSALGDRADAAEIEQVVEESSGHSKQKRAGVLVELEDLKLWHSTLVMEVPALRAT